MILHEFLCMRNKKNPDGAREEISSKMEWMMKHVARKMKSSLEGTEAVKSIELLRTLEALVAKKKGKGQKSKSCFRVIKDVQRIQDITQKQTESHEAEAPYLLIILDQDDNMMCGYILGDGCKIFTNTTSVLDSIIVLFAAYYVFDLDYPAIYCHLLGILQHWVICDPYTGNKTSDWIKFSDELSRLKDKPTFV